MPGRYGGDIKQLPLASLLEAENEQRGNRKPTPEILRVDELKKLYLWITRLKLWKTQGKTMWKTILKKVLVRRDPEILRVPVT